MRKPNTVIILDEGASTSIYRKTAVRKSATNYYHSLTVRGSNDLFYQAFAFKVHRPIHKINEIQVSLISYLTLF